MNVTITPQSVSVTVEAPSSGISFGNPVTRDYVERPAYEGEYSVTPTEEAQTLETEGLRMTGDVTVGAIDSDYVGSGVARKSSADLTAAGATVSVPAGYYAEAASKAVASGSVATPYTSKGTVTNHSVTVTPYYVKSEGYITGSGTFSGVASTVTASELVSGTKEISANGEADVTNYAKVDVDVQPALESVTKTYTPTTSQQTETISPSSGYDGLDEVSVTINAVPTGSATTPTGGITANPTISVSSGGLITASVSKSESITPIVSEGYISAGTAGTITFSGSNTSQLSTEAGKTVTPTTSEQTAVASGKYTTGAIKVAAMPSGTAGTPTASKGTVSNHSVTVTPSVTNTTGYITGGTKTGTGVSVTASELVSGSQTITTNNTYDVTDLAEVVVNVSGGSPNLQTKSKSYTPTESAQSETISADTGYDGLDEVSVSVGAISSTYVGSGITQRTSTDLSASGATVTAPAGYYASAATKTVSSGTAGTPTATKGTVSDHSVSVTPSVTNTTGYITGSTKTGTAVTVTASELVSGSETKTENGTYDVTNLAQLIVNVSGGGGSDRLVLLQTTAIGALQTSSTSAADTGKTVTLAQSTGWQSYDLLLVDISVDTKTNGRHTSTVTPVILTGTSNVTTKNTYTVGSNKWNSKLGSTGTASTRQSTTAYGVYINTASVSSNTLTLTVYDKYNSNNTGTLNGTYTARVYGINLIDLIGG